MKEQERRAKEEQETRGRELQRQIEALLDENQTQRNKIQELEEIAELWKLAKFNEKKEKFMQKTNEEGWNICMSSQEDIQFLFEEFEILDLLQPLNCSSFDDLLLLNTSSAVEMLEVDHVKASKLIFSIEMMTNGIYSKEGKEKHLRQCPICRMEVKKGLDEYGRGSVKDSAAIAAKFAGMHLGEIKNLEISDCIKLGVEKSALLALGTAIRGIKQIHSFDLE